MKDLIYDNTAASPASTSGTEVKMDGVEYTIVRQGDILAIVE